LEIERRNGVRRALYAVRRETVSLESSGARLTAH